MNVIEMSSISDMYATLENGTLLYIIAIM